MKSSPSSKPSAAVWLVAEPTRWLTVDEGDLPFIASFPHTGTTVPAECLAGFESLELARHDTDWHLEKLFEPILPKGTTVVRTDISRSVIDVNRPPDGQSLYPGQATTGLCPQTDFDGVPLYRDGMRLGPEETERRRALYHAPYAEMLTQQISRLRGMHDCVVVLDSARPASRCCMVTSGSSSSAQSVAVQAVSRRSVRRARTWELLDDCRRGRCVDPARH